MTRKYVEIHRSHDEYGPIRVMQHQQRRILCFETQVEQSAIDIDRPYRLVHHYTQAMMLGLLLVPHSPDITVLGLGGGSLASALIHHFPDCRVDAVEQRASVTDIARQWFQLPESERLTLHVQEASDYLKAPPRPQDLILTDLYHGIGMDRDQGEKAFLKACRQALKPDGVLVLNLWSEDFEESRALRRRLDAVFEDRVISTSVPGGNIIAMAFNGYLPSLVRRDFLKNAQDLGQRMDIPLQRYARTLWYENHERLP